MARDFTMLGIFGCVVGWRLMRFWHRYQRLIDRSCRVQRRLSIGYGIKEVDAELGKIVFVVDLLGA
jgi:hypothetical protein